MSAAKYAPADEEGRKPYLVVKSAWASSRMTRRIGWGKTPAAAKYDAFGRLGPYEAIVACRRATPSDMDLTR